MFFYFCECFLRCESVLIRHMCECSLLLMNIRNSYGGFLFVFLILFFFHFFSCDIPETKIKAYFHILYRRDRCEHNVCYFASFSKNSIRSLEKKTTAPTKTQQTQILRCGKMPRVSFGFPWSFPASFTINFPPPFSLVPPPFKKEIDITHKRRKEEKQRKTFLYYFNKTTIYHKNKHLIKIKHKGT